ncbi:MAG: glycosyltransferase family 2 protein [Desulfuromonadales bacterium]|nr:glycosyltransferase family 2 protein [Desulfuromonadales bacterium]
MNTEPTLNDTGNPLISILVYNYDGKYLRQCLESIFQQDDLTNFEVILIDDASKDGSWETALEFVDRHPNIITIHRNRIILGHSGNLRNCLVMAKGEFCTVLTNDMAFLPGYVKSCVKHIRADPFARFGLVCRADDPYILTLSPAVPLPLPIPFPSISKSPLVSILCYNYNYGRYLRQCLESIFTQTYENFELCFSDNASTDESWEIALEFAKKYPEKMHLTRNRKNFGPDANFANCYRTMRGKYFVNFCSDDVLAPEYIERCVNALETHTNAGMVIANRAIIDEDGKRTDEAPFYNQSCIIPGEEQAAVYMMAGINPSVSQIMYRRDVVHGRTNTGALGARYYGTRIFDFNISTDFDVAYIKEPLLLHRIHSQSDTSQADANLMPIVGLYVLNHQFADIASVRNLTKVTGRLPQSIDKLANLAVRYSVRSLLAKDERTSRRYYHLAMAMNPGLADEPTWQKLQQYWTADPRLKLQILAELESSDNLAARTVSYDPPAGSTPI